MTYSLELRYSTTFPPYSVRFLRLASETPIQIPQLNSEVFVSNVSHYLVEEVKYYYLEENGERVLKVVCICRPLGYLPPETPLPE